MSLANVIKAADFAARKHKDQRRKNKSQNPYVNHPIGVAYILTSEAGITDDAVIQGALLHDTVEDTDTTLEEIEENFGKEVRKIVDEVSDDKSLPYTKRKENQILHSPHISTKSKLVKLADKLYNLRDLEKDIPVGWNGERVQAYFEWSAKVCKGMKGTSPSMEEKLEEIFQRHGTSMNS